MPWYEAVGFVLTGFLVGTYGSMVGVGGGFLIVPILLALGNPGRIAAGTSMVVVLANAASSTVAYLRQKRIDVQSGLIFSAAGVPGAIAGAWVDQHLPHRIFTLLFGIVLIAVAVRAVLTMDKPAPADVPSDDIRPHELQRDFVDATGVRHQYSFNLWTALGISSLTGLLASMFGIGGGVVQVPAMVYLFHFPAHVAAATSSFIIFFTALFGSATHAYYGDVLPLPALFLSIGAIGGAQLGSWFASRTRPGRLMRIFSVAVALTALYLIYTSAFSH